MNSELPPDVIQELHKNATALTRLRLQYSEGWALFDSLGELPPKKFTEQFDTARLFQRREVDARIEGGEVDHRTHEYAFDGRFFWSGDHKLTRRMIPATLSKHEGSDASDPAYAVPLVNFPYLECCGFWAPTSMAEMSNFSSINSLVLHEIKQSESIKVDSDGDKLRITIRAVDPVLSRARQLNLEEAGGVFRRQGMSESFIQKRLNVLKQMQQMVPMRITSFLLDRDRQYCVLEREEWTDDKRRVIHIRCDEWSYYESVRVWLPKRCVVSQYTNPEELLEFHDAPLQTVTLVLERVEFGEAEKGKYALDERPEYGQAGTVITDWASPEARAKPNHQISYTRAADGALLRRAADAASLDLGRAQRSFWIRVLIMAFVLAGGILLIFGLRKLEKR